jgi:hypothetical protein
LARVHDWHSALNVKCDANWFIKADLGNSISSFAGTRLATPPSATAQSRGLTGSEQALVLFSVRELSQNFCTNAFNHHRDLNSWLGHPASAENRGQRR